MELTMLNRMPPSNIENSITVSRKRPRESPPPRSSRSPSPQPDIGAPNKRHEQFDYVGGLTVRERVDRVLSQLYGEHRWTIKDLIYYMATEESPKKYAMTAKKRAKDISKAIFDKPEVVDALSQASTHLRDHYIANLAKSFEKELWALRSQPGFGEFNAEIDPRDLITPGLVDRSKELAPGLWHFLQNIIKSQSAGNPEQTKSANSDLFMICMMLAFSNAPRKNNAFPMLLGMHLHSMGVKRRTINLLAGLGITVNYRTVINHTNEVAEIAAVSPGTPYRANMD